MGLRFQMATNEHHIRVPHLHLTRLMFKFRSGTNGLNKELGRHTVGVKMVVGSVRKLCGDECESVVHVLWECPVYGNT